MDDQDEINAKRERARQEELRQRAQNELLQELLETGGAYAARASLHGALRPGDLDELADLARLAAAVKALPHPAPQHAAEQQAVILAAGQALTAGRHNHKERKGSMNTELPTKPRSPGWPAAPVAPGDNHHQRVDSAAVSHRARYPSPAIQRSPAFVLRPLTSLWVAGFAMLLVLGLGLTGLGLFLGGPRGAQAATLMDAGGPVEVLDAAGAWQPVQDGDRVTAGQRLRTGPGGRATLVFFDGTRTSLEPNADVTLAQLGGEWGGVLRVALQQNAGRTQHSVVPLRGGRSSFTVLTPSGAASVHGTNFDVAVDLLGKSRFGVTTGRVLVSSEASDVFLTAGQATAAGAEGLLTDPAYQFSLQGELTSQEGSTWIVQGVPFTVTPDTAVSGFDAAGPVVGDSVRVIGRVLSSGEWMADSVEPSPEDETGETSSFTGAIETMDGSIWQIGGWTVRVNGATELSAGLETGVAVKVVFSLEPNGRWLARSIEALQEQDDELPPTPDPAAQPELVFTPTELKAEACGAETVSLAGALANLAAGPGNTAENVELTAQVVEGADLVEWVEIDPEAWDQIPAGESVGFSVKLALRDAWKTDSHEVKLRVLVLGGLTDSRLTVKVENECEQTETPEVTDEPVETDTPTVTVTPTVTDTPTITVTTTITPTLTLTPTITVTLPVTPTITATPVVTTTVETACTGAQPHPTGSRLAEKYFVPYDEIMSWFCQGFGFGEIDLAYSLSYLSGTPVSEIFAMKSGGMGWGEIKKEFDQRGNPKKWAHPTATPGPGLQPNADPPGSAPGSPGKPDNPGKPNRPPKKKP